MWSFVLLLKTMQRMSCISDHPSYISCSISYYWSLVLHPPFPHITPLQSHWLPNCSLNKISIFFPQGLHLTEIIFEGHPKSATRTFLDVALILCFKWGLQWSCKTATCPLPPHISNSLHCTTFSSKSYHFPTYTLSYLFVEFITYCPSLPVWPPSEYQVPDNRNPWLFCLITYPTFCIELLRCDGHKVLASGV